MLNRVPLILVLIQERDLMVVFTQLLIKAMVKLLLEGNSLPTMEQQEIVSVLKNPDFMEYYDLLCKNSIMITEFISKFDPERITDLEDLVHTIKEEQIVFLKDFLNN